MIAVGLKPRKNIGIVRCVANMEMNQREKALYEFIKGFMIKNHYAPNVREMIVGIGAKSTNTAHVLFASLVKKGYIEQHGKRYTLKGVKYVEVSEVLPMRDDID